MGFLFRLFSIKIFFIVSHLKEGHNHTYDCDQLSFAGAIGLHTGGDSFT